MLEGKTALVTGSTSGIGWGMAQAFAAQRCNIVLNGFGDPQEIETRRSELVKRFGVQAIHIGADMLDPAQIRRMAAQAVDHFGVIHILVNNAGVQHVAPVETFPEDRWDAIIAINLSSAFHAIKALLPRMRQEGWGRIINVASAHGLVASPFKSAYVAAKHGLVGLTKTVALETAGSGITCNAICPGFVLTPLVEKQIDDQAHARGVSREQAVADLMHARQPSKEFVKIDEVAAAAVFLASDGAASMTGSNLSVDGGWVAQ
jgi:3-hydroxybutyrate dehydrogenase